MIDSAVPGFPQWKATRAANTAGSSGTGTSTPAAVSVSEARTSAERASVVLPSTASRLPCPISAAATDWRVGEPDGAAAPSMARAPARSPTPIMATAARAADSPALAGPSHR